MFLAAMVSYDNNLCSNSENLFMCFNSMRNTVQHQSFLSFRTITKTKAARTHNKFCHGVENQHSPKEKIKITIDYQYS